MVAQTIFSYAKTIQQRTTTWQGTNKSEIYSWNFQKLFSSFKLSIFEDSEQGLERQNLKKKTSNKVEGEDKKGTYDGLPVYGVRTLLCHFL